MRFILLSVFILLGHFISAQLFTEVLPSPFEGVWFGAVTFADIDGDNDQDVLIIGLNTAEEPTSKLYKSDGEGDFVLVENTPFTDRKFGSVAFADIDGDSDLDLLITGRDVDNIRSSVLYNNDGIGNFTENTNSALADVSGSSVAFSDVDGDDDQDLFIIGRDNENVSHSKLYLNDGAGNFSESLANAFQPVKDGYIAFADVDGDADQDLLVTGFNGSSGDSRLYINDGVGNFSEMLNTPFHQVSFGAVAFADIDSDEDMDLFITGANPFPTATASMYLNDGNGNFTEDVLNDYDAVTDGAIAFADFDEDGRQDLVITGWSGAESVSNIFMNDGVGNLEKLPTSPFRLAQRSSIAVTDIDGDEDQDLIITGWEGEIARSTLYKNGVLSSISAKNYNSKLDFSILPNPSTSNKIRLNYYSARTGIATVKLLDLQGNIILKKEAKTSTGEQTFLIDISSVPSGMYLVQVTNNGLRGIQKLVVK